MHCNVRCHRLFCAGKFARIDGMGKLFDELKAKVPAGDGAERWLGTEAWYHPKITKLLGILDEHFRANGPDTRAMVFPQYRDSVCEICAALDKNPLIRPHRFVGQSKGVGGKGLKQREQVDVLERFKRGEINTIVATSVGEEGLDIGEVDLIVNFEATGDAGRSVQRMGRTGRKRNGRIIYLLSEKDQRKLAASIKSKLTSGRLLVNGARNFKLYEFSPRMVPRGTELEVERRKIQAVTPMKRGFGKMTQRKRKADPFLTASQDQTYHSKYAAIGTPQVHAFDINSVDLSYSGMPQPTKLATHSKRTEVLIDTLAKIENAMIDSDDASSQTGGMMDLSAYLDPRDVCEEYGLKSRRRPVIPGTVEDADADAAAGPALSPPKGKKARRRQPDPNALYNESSSSSCDIDSSNALPSLEIKMPAERKKQTSATRGNTSEGEVATFPTGGEEEKDAVAEMDDTTDGAWGAAMLSDDNDAGAPLDLDDADTDTSAGAFGIAAGVGDQQHMLQGGTDAAQPQPYTMGSMTLHRTWTPVQLPSADVVSVISELRKLGRRQSLGAGPTNALDQLSGKLPAKTSASSPASPPSGKRGVQCPAGATAGVAGGVVPPSSMVSPPVTNLANPFKAPIGISPFKPKLVKRAAPLQ